MEGEADVIVNDDTTTVRSGSRASITLDSNLQPGNSTEVAAINLSDYIDLPTRLLPRQIVLGTLPSSEPAPTQAIGFGTPSPTLTPQTCTLTAPTETRNMRTGPSTDYPILRVLQANESVTGIGQLNVGGFIWYVTTENGWLRFDSVTVASACTALPVVEAPPLPAPTATPTGAPATAGLNSSLLGDIACPNGRVSASGTSDGRDFSIALGGSWSALAGTSVTFTTQGGQLRPEFGDYIQIIGEDGAILARSGTGTQLQATFDQNQTFVVRFSAANGDLVVMEAVCNGA